VAMDQDEMTAALRNQGLIRQARYADRDRTTAKATIKHMRKAGSSGMVIAASAWVMGIG
jgi:superfamily II DNA helicase RecQ